MLPLRGDGSAEASLRLHSSLRTPTQVSAPPAGAPTPVTALPEHSEEANSAEGADGSKERGVIVVRSSADPKAVPPSYLQMLIDLSSASRALDDRLADPKTAEVQAAAQAFAAIDDDRNGMLEFAEFEQLLLAHSMAYTESEALSSTKVKRMFDKADLNGDGLVDFNEFLVMRERSTGKALKQQMKDAKYESKHGLARGGKLGHHGRGRHGHGKRGHKHATPGLAEDDDESSAAAVGEWVLAVREVEAEKAERRRQEKAAHDEMLARRFGVSDSVYALSKQELEILEGELLKQFPSELSETTAEGCLNMLAMRVGKMFDATEIQQCLRSLVASGTATLRASDLLVSLRTASAARRAPAATVASQ